MMEVTYSGFVRLKYQKTEENGKDNLEVQT